MPVELNPTPYNMVPDDWAFGDKGDFIREVLDLLFQLRTNQLANNDFAQEVTEGLHKYEVVHKFGTNESVGTTYEPVSRNGLYPTVQPASATTLRIKAGGNANDTAAGTGAREITVIGLDETGAEVTETIATNGASASSATTATFTRLYRAYVSSSGTYATASAGSHSATITIEDSGGTQDWAIIDATGFPKGQTEIGVYTVPAGKTATIRLVDIEVEGTKAVDLILFQRTNAMDDSAPYDAMRALIDFIGIEESHEIAFNAPLGPFAAGTDLGFMAKVASGTASVSVDFEIWLY